MKRRVLGCAGAVLVLALLGILLFRPASLPEDARKSIDAYVGTEGSGADYGITWAEQPARTTASYPENLAFISGGVILPAGILAPNASEVDDNWCVILGAPVQTPSGDRTTHLLVQKAGDRWVVAGVPDSGATIFQHFGCGRW